MLRTIASLFQQSRGAPIVIDGQTLLAHFQKELVDKNLSFSVTWIAQVKSPVQGLRFKLNKGVMEINNQKSKDLIIWGDTSPTTINVEVSSAKGGTLKLWNVWRSGDFIGAWTGNSCIHIQRNDIDVCVLECSDGVGEMNLSDLVVRLDWKSSDEE